MKTIKIPELKIEVETKLRQPVTGKDIQIPRGWRLMTFEEACWIYDNLNKELEIGKKTEWIEYYSSRMKERGYFAALYSNGDFDYRLYVDGYYRSGDRYGCAFGVRFVRDLK